MSEPQTQQRAIDVGREVYSLVKEMLAISFPDMPSSEILRVGVAAQDAVRQALSNETDHEVLPDLVAACEAIKHDILPEFLEDHPGSYQAIGLLEAAIAKAKGDQ